MKNNKLPVQVTETEDEIKILAYVSFSESMLHDKLGNSSLADEALIGIAKYWNGIYDGKKLTVSFVRADDPNIKIEAGQKFFKIKTAKISNTSFVLSSPIRWVWGFFRCGFHLESFGLNWSPSNPGSIYLNRYIRLDTFHRTAAHEFGHILGLGDAYGARYRFGYAVPGTEKYMMRSNTMVHPEEVQMMLRAQKTGKMQYFPVKFIWKNFIGTFIKRHK